MRNAFTSLDDALIERLFQPVSDLITHAIGLGRATAACLCIDIASLAWIASRVQGLSHAVEGWDASTAFVDLALLLLGLAAMISLRIALNRTAGQQANPLRQAMQTHRAVVLLMLVARLLQLRTPGLADLADLVMLSCAAVALYLAACAEPPPISRRLAFEIPAG